MDRAIPPHPVRRVIGICPGTPLTCWLAGFPLAVFHETDMIWTATVRLIFAFFPIPSTYFFVLVRMDATPTIFYSPLSVVLINFVSVAILFATCPIVVFGITFEPMVFATSGIPTVFGPFCGARSRHWNHILLSHLIQTFWRLFHQYHRCKKECCHQTYNHRLIPGHGVCSFVRHLWAVCDHFFIAWWDHAFCIYLFLILIRPLEPFRGHLDQGFLAQSGYFDDVHVMSKLARLASARPSNEENLQLQVTCLLTQ